MVRHTLSALLATAAWAAAVSPTLAQGSVKKPASAGAAKSAPAGKPTTDLEVVGSVNGKPFTWTELVARAQQDDPQEFSDSIAKAVGSKITADLFGPNPKSQVTLTRAEALALLRKNPTQKIVLLLNNLLTQEALKQEVAHAAVQVTDARVDGYMNRLLQQARAQGNIPASVTDDQFLASRNYTRAKLKVRLRPQVQTLDLIAKDLEKTMSHPVGPNDFVQARHILLLVKEPTPDVKPEEAKKADEEILAKIKQISADIKAGKKTFADAAKENSEDPGSKAKGGDLGPFLRGTMVKEFDNAAFSLKPGDISDPVRSTYGYHIIQVEKLGKDLTPAERQSVLDTYSESHYQQFIVGLSQRAKIVNDLGKGLAVNMGMQPSRPGPRPGVTNRNPRVPQSPSAGNATQSTSDASANTGDK